jgi:hypothetical protein
MELLMRSDMASIRGRLGTALALGVLLATAPGCLFSPRDPEPPASNTAVDYLDQILPENVWTNLGKSLENTDSGGWERNISEDFVYVADSDADTQFPDVFFDVGAATDGWERTQEVEFIRKFYSFGPIITGVKMIDDDFVPPPASGTEVLWERVIYDVTVESDGSLTRYRGEADVTFNLVGTEWFVTRWDDRAGASDPGNPTTVLPTLGFLRGTTASN